MKDDIKCIPASQSMRYKRGKIAFYKNVYALKQIKNAIKINKKNLDCISGGESKIFSYFLLPFHRLIAETIKIFFYPANAFETFCLKRYNNHMKSCATPSVGYNDIAADKRCTKKVHFVCFGR